MSVVSSRRVAKRSLDVALFHRACLRTWPSSKGLAVFTLKNFFLSIMSIYIFRETSVVAK